MSDAPKGHLVFACGESLYAVPAECAAEVVSLPVPAGGDGHAQPRID